MGSARICGEGLVFASWTSDAGEELVMVCEFFPVCSLPHIAYKWDKSLPFALSLLNHPQPIKVFRLPSWHGAPDFLVMDV